MTPKEILDQLHLHHSVYKSAHPDSWIAKEAAKELVSLVTANYYTITAALQNYKPIDPSEPICITLQGSNSAPHAVIYDE